MVNQRSLINFIEHFLHKLFSTYRFNATYVKVIRMIIVAVFIVFLGFYWIFWVTGSRQLDKATAALPMPPGLPLIGHALLFIGSTESKYTKFT